MRSVSRALPEQRGEGCEKLEEPVLVRARQPKNSSPRPRHGAEVHVTDALNGPLAPADRDGPVRKRFSDRTVAVPMRGSAPRAC